MEDDPTRLITDKNEINKRFFEKLQNLSSDECAELPEEDLQKIKEIAQSYRNQAQDSARLDLERAEQFLASYRREYQASLADVAKKRDLLASLQDAGPVTKEQALIAGITETIDAGFWGDFLFDGRDIWVRTMNDITMFYRNRAAGIDMNVNMGQLSARINLADQMVSVFPYRNNLKARGIFYHPHISEDGELCWGNAFNMAEQKLLNWELKEYLSLLQSLLTTYCPDRPYARLDEFENAPSYGRASANLMSLHKERDRNLREEARRRRESENSENSENSSSEETQNTDQVRGLDPGAVVAETAQTPARNSPYIRFDNISCDIVYDEIDSFI
jgi:hypothetical protein